MWPKIEFEVDEPVLVHLRYPNGKEVTSKYYERWPGDTTQYLFMCAEGLFYLPDCAGALLNARLRSSGYRAGEPLSITKRSVENPNSSRKVTEYVPSLYRVTFRLCVGGAEECTS